MVVTLNGHKFAESITDLKYNPKNYEGYVRRYKNALEIYAPDMSPLVVINRYGVILGFTKDATGKKAYRVLFRDDPLLVQYGRNLITDLKNIALERTEHYIDTRKNGGMFSAYPDHLYRFGVI